MKLKKVLSLLMACVLAVSTCPIQTKAADDNISVQSIVQSDENDTLEDEEETANEEVTKEEITEEEATEEEATEEEATEEETTEEETTEEETTEEETTEEETIEDNSKLRKFQVSDIHHELNLNVENISIDINEDENSQITDDNGYCTGFCIPYIAKVNIGIDGLADDVKDSEIDNLLSGKKIEVNLNGNKVYSLELSEYKDEIINGNTITIEETAKVTSAGEHNISIEALEANKDATVTIDKLSSEELLDLNDINGKEYYYGDDIECTVPEFMLSNIKCSDNDNNAVAINNRSGNKLNLINNNKGKKDESEVIITIEYPGNNIYEGTSETATLNFKKKDMPIDFNPVEGDGTYEYGDTIEFTRTEGDSKGEVVCYISDADGKENNDGSLIIKKLGNDNFAITGSKISGDGPFYVTFKDSGDGFYNSNTCTYKIYVTKMNLTQAVEMKSLENQKQFKTRVMLVDVTVSAKGNNFTSNDAENVSFDIQLKDKFGNVCSNVGYIFMGYTDNKDGSFTYHYKLDYEATKKLTNSDKYTLEAVASFGKDLYVLGESSDTNESFTVSQDTLTVNIKEKSDLENEGIELNNRDDNKITYNLNGNKPYNMDEYPVSAKYESSDDSVIKIDSDGNFTTERVGTAILTVTVDDKDNDSIDIYEAATETVTIEVKSPKCTDYTINGSSPSEVLGNPTTSYNGENWFDDNLVIKTSGNNIYTQVKYRVLGSGDEWTTVDLFDEDGSQTGWTISTDMVTSYEFYFADESRNAYSDKIITLENIGIDKQAPALSASLTTTANESGHSTGTMAYFADNITLTASSKKSGVAVDKGSGVARITVNYISDDGTVTYSEDINTENDRYATSYDILLDQSAVYGKVTIMATDFVGHESIVASYDKQICIDKVNPEVTFTPIYTDNNTEYDQEWTNRQVEYVIDSLEDSQVSGIYKYEYAFIPRGSYTDDMDIDGLTWTKVEKDKLYLIFGSDDESEYARKNGTILVRAESNASLISTPDTVKQNKKELKIWQQVLEEVTVNFDNTPDEQTGWYNKQTDIVNVTFEYPEYDEKNHAPVTEIVYELDIEYEDKEETIETKSFFNGEGHNDELPTLCFDQNSISTLKVYVQDAAGNKSKEAEYEIKADYTSPDAITASADGGDLKVYLEESGGSSSYVIFTQDSVSVDASAEYGISQKQSFSMELVKSQGEKGSGSGDNDSLSIDPCSRGLVYICAIDGAGNKTEGWTDGIVSDNQAPVGSDGTEITIQTDGMNSEEFYNDDIPLTISVNDSPSDDGYSGIKSVAYQVGKSGEQLGEEISLSYNNAASMSWSEIESLYSYENSELVISAKDNESNQATITVTATDNAGNTTTTSKEIKIDVTNPVVEISFDTNNAKNEKYYNTVRTAQIDITELNFDPSKVEITVYRNGENDYSVINSLTSWTSGEDLMHTAYLTFDQDGDYYFEVKCTDRADNESETVTSESFTIDMTKPVIRVSYDNLDSWNQSYYNKERTATITVTEHNFNEKDFEAVIEPAGTITGWTHDGDDHKTTIRFYDEESYSYKLNYTDLAGNSSDEYGPDEFTVDITAPEIIIEGVGNHSANAGNINPVVYITDKNFDTEGVVFELANSKGLKIAVQSETEAIADGYKYTLTNLNSLDDAIYTLTVTAVDMAGNPSRETVKYSLNRNGSVYDLSQISSLVDKKYVRYTDMEDLHITEMNVNTISEFKLYITKNNKAIEATQVSQRPINADGGIYYSVSVIGNEDTGYEYDYTIYRESFADEGIYNVMFYSKDEAGNEVNNTLSDKNADLTFVVDNTAPTVVAAVSEDKTEVNVSVKDNIGLGEAYFEVQDTDGSVMSRYNYLELVENMGDVLTIEIPNENVTLYYYASDYAGNENISIYDGIAPKSDSIISSLETGMYVNDNNRLGIIWGILAGTAAVLIGAAAVLLYRKRK